MHVHTPHDVSVAHKATAPTGPVASFRLLLPVAPWTAAAGSPLTAAEAHDADSFTLLLEILLVLAVLPLAHALVVMPPFVLSTHPVRIAHIERLHPFSQAEVDHLTRALMPQIAHPPLLLASFSFFGILQASPTLGALLATGLQAREMPERPVVSLLDGAHAAPSHDQSLARCRGDSPLVDLAQVGGRPNELAGGSLGGGSGCGSR